MLPYLKLTIVIDLLLLLMAAPIASALTTGG